MRDWVRLAVLRGPAHRRATWCSGSTRPVPTTRRSSPRCAQYLRRARHRRACTIEILRAGRRVRVLARAHPPGRGHHLGHRQRAARLPHRPVPDHGARHQRQDALDRAADERRRAVRDRRRRFGAQARAAVREGEPPALGLARRVPRAGGVARVPRAEDRQRDRASCSPTRSTAPPASVLDENRSPSRKVHELDNRGSHFYLALYWAAGAGRARPTTPSWRRASRPSPTRWAPTRTRSSTSSTTVQGSPVDIGGYYHPDDEAGHRGHAPERHASTPSSTRSDALERAARRAEHPPHAPAHADAPGRGRRRLPADERSRASAACCSARSSPSTCPASTRSRSTRSPAWSTWPSATASPCRASRCATGSRPTRTGSTCRVTASPAPRRARAGAADPRARPPRPAGAAGDRRAHGRGRGSRRPAGGGVPLRRRRPRAPRRAARGPRGAPPATRASRACASAGSAAPTHHRRAAARPTSGRGVPSERRWAMEVLGLQAGHTHRARRRPAAVPAPRPPRPPRPRRRARGRGRAHRRAGRGARAAAVGGRRRPLGLRSGAAGSGTGRRRFGRMAANPRPRHRHRRRRPDRLRARPPHRVAASCSAPTSRSCCGCSRSSPRCRRSKAW